jgi:hypothetical protein
MTVGNADMLSSYVSPFTIWHRSVTGQILGPEGAGRLSFEINTGKGSLSVICQHTPVIKSSIFSPSATCDSLGYEIYQLTCDSRTHTSTVYFCKSGAPVITLHGTYIQRMAFISLPPEDVQSIFPDVPHLLDPTSSARQPDPLALDSATLIHQVLHLVLLVKHHPIPTPEDCRLGILHLFHESLSDDWTHRGIPEAPVFMCRTQLAAPSDTHGHGIQARNICYFFQIFLRGLPNSSTLKTLKSAPTALL